jgi:hypothetical protein
MKITTILFCLALVLSQAAAQDAITPAGHVELFNGQDFAGWKFFERGNPDPMKTWSITNGLLECTGKPAGYMRTDKMYRDFKVTVEWRFPANMTKAINTGVCVFMQDRDANTPTNLVWGNSIECQGMHGHQGDFWFWGGADCAEPKNNGHNNSIKMLQPSAEKSAGEWNTFEVICQTNTVEIIVNGTSMNKATGCNHSSGYIGLQSEGGPWEARKISIEPLP